MEALLPGDPRPLATLLARRTIEAPPPTRQLYERATALAGIGVWECRLEDEALTWTDSVYDLFELPRQGLIESPRIAALYDPASRREMERLRAEAIRSRGSFTMEARIRTARGRDRWMRLIAAVDCESGGPARLFGVKQDITEERLRWEEMRRLAECDPLTGLANRGVFQARFWDHGQTAGLAALMLIDLDGFKQVNDGLGHLAGDECLRRVAARLRQAHGDALLLARLGGDEFAVMIAGPADRATIERRARATLKLLREPIAWQGQRLQVSASIGIAIVAGPGYEPPRLFAQADGALYAAKAAGRNGFTISLAAG